MTSPDLLFSQMQQANFHHAARMAYVDFKLQFTGAIRRIDLQEVFGLGEAAASKIFAEYKELRPNNMAYNRSQFVNTILLNTFEPLLQFDVHTALFMLVNGFDSGLLKPNDRAIASAQLMRPKANLSDSDVSKITRAISGSYAISIGGKHIKPLALVALENEWFFRAYDCDSKQYVLRSFANACAIKEAMDMKLLQTESLLFDKDWVTHIPIVLRIHDALPDEYKDQIRADFALPSNESTLTISERKALYPLLARQWMIDDGDNELPFFKFKLTNAI